MYNQGDIILIPIPFSDLTSTKKRPALVISKNGYNQKTDDLIVMAITSMISDKEFCINISNNDLISGSILVESQIRADKIYTISQNIVLKVFAKVKSYIIKYARDNLMTITE